MPFSTTGYGVTADGRAADLITLTNASGMTAKLTNFGAILVGLTAANRHGKFSDVTLGYDSLDGWVSDTAYLGATVGRVGNRISGRGFKLDGVRYTVEGNADGVHLHGGTIGYNKRIWQSQPFEDPGVVGVTFRLHSPDGEEGYPGNLACAVTYTLNDANELGITFEATTDATTIVNMVHHTYWNLSGTPGASILDHQLKLNADFWTRADHAGIPTGEVVSVANSAMDFRIKHRIGERLEDAPGGFYDQNWVTRTREGEMALVATVRDPISGRIMELESDQQGVQFYCAGFMDGSITGKGGVIYEQFAGLCLETQRWPDAPNKPHFPSPVLRPGETYRHRMIHRFSAD